MQNSYFNDRNYAEAMKDVFLKLEEQLTTPQGKEQVARLQSQKNQFKGT